MSAVRLHWGIENQLHWVLDMSFGEDQNRIRQKNTSDNITIIRHAALNTIKQAKRKKIRSIKLMRKTSGWDNDLLHKILTKVF